MPNRLCVCFFLLAGGWCASPVRATPAPLDGYLVYSGTATARHSTHFLYGERHVLFYRAGRLAERVVLYTCGDGSSFARKTVSYVVPAAPDFFLDDTASGMREGVRSGVNGRSVFFRENRTAIEKSGPLPTTAGLVIDAGFDEYIRANWEALMAGRTLGLHFLVPSRLGDISFQVLHLRSDTIERSPVEVFRLKLTGFWGWILPGIDVSYSVSERVLLRYDGLSDLRDPSGNNVQAEIIFPTGDRKVGAEADLTKAVQARLAPCK
jgi:hypothetical protein